MSYSIIVITFLVYFNNFLGVVNSEPEYFDQERASLFILEATNDDQREIIKLLHHLPALDVWRSENVDGKLTVATVLIPNSINIYFKTLLDLAYIKYEEAERDMHRILKEEREQRTKKSECSKDRYVAFDCYMTYDEINNYLDQLATSHSEKVRVFSIGKSYEGRDMKMIHISNNFDSIKPAIIVEGGMHAREWISPAQVLYIIHRLVDNMTQEDAILLDNVDWYILPIVNPDGYVYTHTKNRLWRRSRAIYSKAASRQKRFTDPKLYEPLLDKIPKHLIKLIRQIIDMLSYSSFSCVGVDLNRNWNIDWIKSYPCFDMYSGVAPFSESETRNIANFVETIHDRIKLYLSFHSFGQKIMYPYGFTHNPTNNEKELKCLGYLVNDAMEIDYTVGNSGIIEYPVYGSSDDWFKAALNVSLVYTIELPPRDRTPWGQSFIVDPQHIQTIVEDMYSGVRVLGSYVAYKYSDGNIRIDDFEKCIAS